MSPHTAASYCVSTACGFCRKPLLPQCSGPRITPAPHFPPRPPTVCCPKLCIPRPSRALSATFSTCPKIFFALSFSTTPRLFFIIFFFFVVVEIFDNKRSAVWEKKTYIRRAFFPIFFPNFFPPQLCSPGHFRSGFSELPCVIVCSAGILYFRAGVFTTGCML